MKSYDEEVIKDGLDFAQRLIGDWGREKGWNDDRSPGELIALMHSELSEALEEYRHDPDVRKTYIKNAKPEGFFVELADCMIRILHMAELYEVKISDALLMKMEYNEMRPVRHGGKTI